MYPPRFSHQRPRFGFELVGVVDFIFKTFTNRRRILDNVDLCILKAIHFLTSFIFLLLSILNKSHTSQDPD
eukprot:SAG22_NODE_27_length_29018_cov_465.809646_25_plen_71_part_00